MSSEDAQTARGTFYFDPNDPIYADHFPGNPVVPGSLIIQGFLSAAGQLLNESAELTLKGFRFKKFIPPGGYDYEIQNTADIDQRPVLKCALFYNRRKVVTGVIEI